MTTTDQVTAEPQARTSGQSEWGPYPDFEYAVTPWGGYGVPAGQVLYFVEEDVEDQKNHRVVRAMVAHWRQEQPAGTGPLDPSRHVTPPKGRAYLGNVEAAQRAETDNRLAAAIEKLADKLDEPDTKEPDTKEADDGPTEEPARRTRRGADRPAE